MSEQPEKKKESTPPAKEGEKKGKSPQEVADDVSQAGGAVAGAAVQAAASGANPGKAAGQAASSALLPKIDEVIGAVAKIGATAGATYLGVKALEALGEPVGKVAVSAADAAVAAALSGASPGKMVKVAAASTAATLAATALLQAASKAVLPAPEPAAKPGAQAAKQAEAAAQQSAVRVSFQVASSRELLPVVRMAGDESLSRPFWFDITLALPAAEAVGGRCRKLLLQEARLIVQGPVQNRTIHGIVLKLDLESVEGERALIRARLVPALMRLSLNRRLRIFQDQTTPQIVEAVLEENGIANADWGKLAEKYQPRNYCVQYRESDLDFVSRLLEEEGIFYFYDAGDDNEPKLIFADHWRVHAPIPGPPKVAFSTDPRATQHTEVVRALVLDQQVAPQKLTLCDYAFRNPALDLSAGCAASGKDRLGELYDYPGEFVEQPSGLGERLARVRMEELELSRAIGTAISNSNRFRPGRTFVLGGTASGEQHPCPDLNQEYLVIQVHHSAALSGPYGTPTGYTYNTVLTVCPTSVEGKRRSFRPPRMTSRPMVVGLHTATVVAPPGEEIHTDSDGRVRVHFPWHRGTDSCWIRVAQPWAGAGFGAFFLPRKGEEVLVAFLEGDPDRPLIVGRVHNRAQPPGHSLPAHKAWSYIRTHSTPSSDGYNEIRFQDENGDEQIFVHAQRDLRMQVHHDEQVEVQNVYQLVAGQRIELVVGDSKVVISRDGITVNGRSIAAVAEDHHVIKGGLVKINCS